MIFSALVILGSFIMLLSMYKCIAISHVIPQDFRRRWKFTATMIGAFTLLYIGVLMANKLSEESLQVILGVTLLLGSIFVYTTLKYVNEVSHAIKIQNNESILYTEKINQLSRSAILTRFADSISHDLRNPLAVVALNVELAQESSLTDEILQRITRSISDMEFTIESVHAFSESMHRIQTGSVDLMGCLRSTRELVDHKLRNNSINLEFFDLGHSVAIDGVEAHLKTVLIMFVLNSFKMFLRQNGTERKISIRVDESGSQLRLIYKDNAGEMSVSDLRNIERTETRFIDKEDIFGLRAAASLMRDMGGDLEVVAADSIGTTFALIMNAAAAVDSAAT